MPNGRIFICPNSFADSEFQPLERISGTSDVSHIRIRMQISPPLTLTSTINRFNNESPARAEWLWLCVAQFFAQIHVSLCMARRILFASACSLLLVTLSEQARAELATEGFDKGSRIFRPVKVVSTTGNVRNAEALVAGHEGYATLTMEDGGTAPMVILDYGRDVGGLPVCEVSAVWGTPKLQAIYSEAQKYLLPSGDAPTPTGGSGQTFVGEVSFVGNASAGDLAG